jgi:hypothetical protein
VTEVHDLTLSVTGCTTQQAIRDQLAMLLDGRQGLGRVTITGELDPRIDLHVEDLTDVPHLLEGLQIRLGDVWPAYAWPPSAPNRRCGAGSYATC